MILIEFTEADITTRLAELCVTRGKKGVIPRLNFWRATGDATIYGETPNRKQLIG